MTTHHQEQNGPTHTHTNTHYLYSSTINCCFCRSSLSTNLSPTYTQKLTVFPRPLLQQRINEHKHQHRILLLLLFVLKKKEKKKIFTFYII
uniref:Uncharacterized protein n=1 Tax=Strigamia maritima TaxID=126957 RepID=T1J3T8_STRMM